MKKETETPNALCKDCWNFKTFGTKCFFYWDNKKECSNYVIGETDPPKFKSVLFSQ